MGTDVTLLPEAVCDLYGQAEYYERSGSSETAERWLDQARATLQFLTKNPQIGAVWPVPRQQRRLAGVRTWRIQGFEKFIVFYRPVDSGIEVLRVLHGSRDVDHIL